MVDVLAGWILCFGHVESSENTHLLEVGSQSVWCQLIFCAMGRSSCLGSWHSSGAVQGAVYPTLPWVCGSPWLGDESSASAGSHCKHQLWSKCWKNTTPKIELNNPPNPWTNPAIISWYVVCFCFSWKTENEKSYSLVFRVSVTGSWRLEFFREVWPQ